jgi:hypothetical protein
VTLTLAEASQLNQKGHHEALRDPLTSAMPDLSFNDHLQPDAGSGNTMEHAEIVLGKGYHLQPMTKCNSAPPMPPLVDQEQKESAKEETN